MQLVAVLHGDLAERREVLLQVGLLNFRQAWFHDLEGGGQTRERRTRKGRNHETLGTRTRREETWVEFDSIICTQSDSIMCTRGTHHTHGIPTAKNESQSSGLHARSHLGCQGQRPTRNNGTCWLPKYFLKDKNKTLRLPTSLALNPSKALVSTLVDIPDGAQIARKSTGRRIMGSRGVGGGGRYSYFGKGD